MTRLKYEIDARDGQARAGRVTLPRGSFDTPVFMPVGTRATVKALGIDDLQQLGAEIILANAYHLAMRPGEKAIEQLGGLHRFMSWPGLILTDSGGFQLFSLRALTKVSDDGVLFRSHVDGSERFIGPAEAMAIQAALGSDVAMVLDECPPSDAPREQIERAMRRTTAWAERCAQQPRPDHQVRFGIIQGGVNLELRRQHLEEIAALPFEGCALGGLSVGEGPALMHEVVTEIAPLMPEDRPRYLMGVGRPEDLVRAIGAGIDMFDCVLPTRNARNGHLFNKTGRIVISNACHASDSGPIDRSCGCPVCARYSRAYLRHLHLSREILYSRLATLHNLHFVITLVQRAREAIRQGCFEAFAHETLAMADHSKGHANTEDFA